MPTATHASVSESFSASTGRSRRYDGVMPRIVKPADTFAGHLGTAIKAARTNASMSQEDVAEATGIPITNLGRSERGGRDTTVHELSSIAAAVSTTPAEIATNALKGFGGGTEAAGLARLVSEAAGTTDELAKKRAQRQAADMTSDEIDEQHKRGKTAAQQPAGDEGDDEPAAP